MKFYFIIHSLNSWKILWKSSVYNDPSRSYVSGSKYAEKIGEFVIAGPFKNAQEAKYWILERKKNEIIYVMDHQDRKDDNKLIGALEKYSRVQNNIKNKFPHYFI